MALKGAYLVAVTAMLMSLQCCNHICHCNENGFVEEEDNDDDLFLEVEDEEEATISLFVPTHEWQTVKEGQAIPAGLHIRMNMETGKKEAKLMDDPPTKTEERTEDKQSEPETVSQHDDRGTKDPPPVDNEHLTTGTPHEDGERGEGEEVREGGKRDETGSQLGEEEGNEEREGEFDQSSDFTFNGDQRRAHYYGHSDRIGIINKRRRMFTQREAAEALREDNDETNTQKVSGMIGHSPLSLQDQPMSTVIGGDGAVKLEEEEDDEGMERLGRPIHRELSEMLRHTKTLASKTATIPELSQALEELEYYVHHIDNAKELNSVGGLVVVVRLLNHSHPEIRSGAAHVIGAATQSNPQVQSEVLDYGGLQLLCQFIGSREPELVQRRGLFALSALLRGNTQPQLTFVQECHGLMQLGLDFDLRTMPTQLKIVTLLTDLLHEQDDVMHNSEELRALLHNSVQQHGWCEHVPSLLHTDTLSPTEKALQAMTVLQDLCDFTGHLPRLQELHRQFQESVKEQEDDDDNEVSLSLLNHSQELLTNIRNRNKEL